MSSDRQYKKGHFIGMGMAIGLPLGIPLGMAMGNIAMGPAIGVPFGFGIGVLLEKKLNKNPVPLTDFEKKRQKIWSWIGITIGIVVAGVLVTYYFNK